MNGRPEARPAVGFLLFWNWKGVRRLEPICQVCAEPPLSDRKYDAQMLGMEEGQAMYAARFTTSEIYGISR